MPFSAAQSTLEKYLKAKLSATSTPTEEYFALLTFTMTRFQLLEQELKSYLITAHKQIKREVGELFEYRWDQAGILSLSLGQLIPAFRKHGGDPELCRRIKDLVKGRNKIAHEGFVTEFEEFEHGVTVDLAKTRLPELRQLAKDVEGTPLLVAEARSKIHHRLGALNLRRARPVDPDDASTPFAPG
jgi:hypothetical protein